MWDVVVEIISRINSYAGSMKSLRQIDKDLKTNYDKYWKIQADLLVFFKNTNSPESIQDKYKGTYKLPQRLHSNL